jgi:hypothetical protein
MNTELAEQNQTNRAGSVWEYVSASRLNLWLRCGLAFRLRYIDRVPEPTTASLFVGKQVHRALEFLYRRRQVGLVTELDEVNDSLLAGWEEGVHCEGVQFANHKEEAAAREQVISLLTAYCRQFPSDEPRPLAVETSLSCPLVDPRSGEDLGMPLVGIVDLVLPEQAGALIADFKTAASSRPPPEIQHEIQLSCYSYLFSSVSGQQETALEIRSLARPRRRSSCFIVLLLGRQLICKGCLRLCEPISRISNAVGFSIGLAGPARCAIIATARVASGEEAKW